jgi:hypothetical protein
MCASERARYALRSKMQAQLKRCCAVMSIVRAANIEVAGKKGRRLADCQEDRGRRRRWEGVDAVWIANGTVYTRGPRFDGELG